MAKQKDAAATIVGRVLSDFEEDLKAHDPFIQKADKMYRAYRGLLEDGAKVADWRDKPRAAYVFQSIETMVASLLDPSPKWRLRAMPAVADPAEIERLRAGARANELLLNHQLSLDYFAEKQRVIDLQALIIGLTVTKQSWDFRVGQVRGKRYYDEPAYNDYGEVIGTVPRVEDTSVQEVLRDDPTCDPVDVRDWVPHEGAISLAKCQRVTHRLWYTFDELKRLEAVGVYENVDALKDSKDQTEAARLYNREQDLFQVNRAKGQIEVLEQWRVDPSVPGGMRVVSVGNKNALLRDRPSPFWLDRLEHQYPFMVCSGTPDLFRIPGISDVEMMQALQEQLWALSAQRLTNLELINNAIFLIADDIEDPDAFEFAPGARWPVSRPVQDTVLPWSPNPIVAQVSLEAEALLKGDLQNIPGGLPFMSGTQSQTVDQETATGVSIVTSLAQRRLAAKKQQFTWAKRRIGEQWCALNQQFVTGDRLVPKVGMEGAQDFEEIRGELLQGAFVFETELAEESLMRQERRAEAQAKLQVALNAAQYFVNSPGQPALNLKAYMDDYLEAFDISDRERYYTQSAPPGTPIAQPGGQQQQASADSGQGVTSALASGISSPSHVESMSPEVFLQRQGTMTGGPVNQP